MALPQSALDLLDRWTGKAQPVAGYGSADEAKPVFLIEVNVRNIQTDADETFYASDSGYVTPDADASDFPAPSRVRLATLSASLVQGSDAGHSAPVLAGEVVLANHDGFYDAYLDDTTYSWVGKNCWIHLGATTWRFDTQFAVVQKYKIEGVAYNDDTIHLTLKPVFEQLRRPVQDNLYGGFGGAYSFLQTGTKELVNFGDVHNPGFGPYTLEIRFNHDLTISTNEWLAGKRDTITIGTDAGINTYISSGGTLVCRVSDGTTAKSIVDIGSANEFLDGVDHMLSIVYDNVVDEEVRAYVDGNPEGTNASVTGLGTLSDKDVPFTVAVRGLLNSNYFTGTISEVRVWSTARTQPEIANNFDRSMTGTEKGLVAVYKFSEYGGADILNEQATALLAGVSYDNSGGDESISFGNNMNVTTGSFSAFGWVRIHAIASANHCFWSKKGDGAFGTAGWMLRYLSSTDEIEFNTSDATTAKVASALIGDLSDSGRWIAVAVAYDKASNEQRIYTMLDPGGDLVIGETTDITSQGSLSNAVTCYHGRLNDNTNKLVFGATHAFTWTDEVLTREQMEAGLRGQVIDLDAELPTPDPFFKTLSVNAHHYPFDENAGTTVNDQIGAVNGTLTAASQWFDSDGDITKGNGKFVTTLEGDEQLKGLPKPVALGGPRRVFPVLVDTFFNVWQWSDPAYGATFALETAFEGAFVLSENPAGDYDKDLANSTITRTNAMIAPLTVDVKGIDEVTEYFHRTGSIIREILETMLGLTTADYDTTSLDDYDVAFPYQIGLYLDARPHLLEEVLDSLLQPRGFWTQGIGGGKFKIGLLVNPDTVTSTFSIKENEIEDMRRLPGVVPVWRRRLAYDRTWGVHDNFLTAATTENQRLHSQEFRWVRKLDKDLKEDHVSAAEVEDGSLIVRRRDAAIEAKRLFDRDGRPVDLWTMSLGRHAFRFDVGDVIDISRDDGRLAFGTAKNLQVVGYTYTFGTDVGFPKATLQLRG